MTFLNPNNPVHIFLNRIGDLVMLNLLFLLTSIPVITIGPSLAALFSATLKLVKGNESSIVRLYIDGFKQNFFPALKTWLLLLVLFLLCLGNLQFLQTTNHPMTGILYYSTFGILILFVAFAVFFFPVLAAFWGSLPMLYRNTFSFLFMRFSKTILVLACSLLPMIMTYLDLQLLPLYATCWFFFGFSLTAYVDSLLLYPLFSPYLDSPSDDSQK